MFAYCIYRAEIFPALFTSIAYPSGKMRETKVILHFRVGRWGFMRRKIREGSARSVDLLVHKLASLSLSLGSPSMIKYRQLKRFSQPDAPPAFIGFLWRYASRFAISIYIEFNRLRMPMRKLRIVKSKKYSMRFSAELYYICICVRLKKWM